MSAEALQVAGTIAAALAAGAAIAIEDRRLRAAGMTLALAFSVALVAGEAWETEIADLRDEPALVAGALAAGALAVGGLAVAFRARPEVLPLAVIAVLPFRVPIEAGGESSNLLVPLYVVIAAGVGAYAYAALRDLPAEPAQRLPRLLRAALAATLVLYAVQTAYSDDVSRAAQQMAFFLAPFAVMFVLLVETRWSARLLRLALAVVVAEALVFAAMGILQHELRFTFWNDAIAESNEFHFYFRVNSLFWDSNFYGRHLAVVAILVMAWLLWERDARRVAGGAAILLLVAVGMAFGFSQTSSAALLVGLAVLGALRWSLRGALAAVGCITAIGLAGLVAFGEKIEFDFSSLSLEKATSGRTGLVEGGLDLAEQRPVAGHGSGSFVVLYREQNDLDPDIAAVSHTEPITIAAEQGAVGLVAYLVLLAAIGVTLLTGMGRLAPGIGDRGHSGFPDTAPEGVARIAIAAASAAVLVHTMGYAAFLTDPLTWALVAVGAALAPAATARG